MNSVRIHNRRYSPENHMFGSVRARRETFLARKLRVLRPMFCYMLGYLFCFGLIEQWHRVHYTVIHTAVDDMIPFCAAFVIPYLLWFPYVIGAVLFLLFTDEEAYHKLCSVLAIGMTVFIAVSVVFPNIHLMRPLVTPGDDLLCGLVSAVYALDTPTNLTPSIHVFNSLAVIAAYWKWDWRTETGRVYSPRVKNAWRLFITVLGALISLSTMLIKQHSFSDVVTAAVLFVITFTAVYRHDMLLIGTGRHTRSGRPAHQFKY